MAKTPDNIGWGGSHADDQEALFNGIADDLGELRTQVVALLAKLDADAGVSDTDYAATLTPAARTHLGSDE